MKRRALIIAPVFVLARFAPRMPVVTQWVMPTLRATHIRAITPGPFTAEHGLIPCDGRVIPRGQLIRLFEDIGLFIKPHQRRVQ